MSLTKQTQANVDISDYLEVLDYTNGTVEDQIVLGQVDLGRIAGGGIYTLRTFIGALRVSPDSLVNVGAGVTSTCLQSRRLILEPSDQITVQVIGLPGDTDIDTVAQLLNVKPVTKQVLYGDGSTVVDHNYGGDGTYVVENPDNIGINNVHIYAVTAADYNAGNRSDDYMQARTTTNVNGQWRDPFLLDAGDYVLLFSKQGEYQTQAVNLTVS
jgi:hypothetical protein